MVEVKTFYLAIFPKKYMKMKEIGMGRPHGFTNETSACKKITTSLKSNSTDSTSKRGIQDPLLNVYCVPLGRHPPGQTLPQADTSLDRHPPDQIPLNFTLGCGLRHPPVGTMTDTCKNITFATSLQTVINEGGHINSMILPPLSTVL